MDPGSIIAAIDTTLGVCGHVVELFQAIKDIRELPDAFKQLGTKIALVEEILNKTRDVIVARTDERDREVAMQTIKSCQEQIQQLQDILEIIQKNSGDPQADSFKIWSSIKKFYRNAVLRLGKGSKGRVEDLTKEILESLRLLSQWCGLEDQLKKAMDDINNVEASLEDEECEPTGSNTLNNGGQCKCAWKHCCAVLRRQLHGLSCSRIFPCRWQPWSCQPWYGHLQGYPGRPAQQRP